MKKRWVLLIAAMLMALVCSWAAAEEAQYVNFPIYIGTGETVQPDYPDWAPLIGEGLTKDDFDITYRITAASLTLDEDGVLTMNTDYTYGHVYKMYVIYTPKVAGVGVKTEFYCEVFTGNGLRGITVEPASVKVALGQEKKVVQVSCRAHLPKALEVSGFDESIVHAEIKQSYPGQDSGYWQVHLTPQAVGETTITVIGYNGVSADIPVKVMLAPTQLTFSAEEYICYVGDKLELETTLGEGEHLPEFSKALVRYGHTWYGASKYFPQGLLGYFTTDVGADYEVEAVTYNGYSAKAIIRVYDRENVVRIDTSQETLRVGEQNISLRMYDANGRKLRPQHWSITKGVDIVTVQEDWYATKTLELLDVGEFEVTVCNLDGSTCTQTFNIEPYPTEIILNAEEVTLEIGESFDVEVGFDQGNLPYVVYLRQQDKTEAELGATRMEGDRIIAQAPGTAVYTVEAGRLSKNITITVAESDRAVYIDGLDEPLIMGEGYQLYVRDKTGKIYPAAFSFDTTAITSCVTITAGGYLEALNACSKFGVIAQLEDGRTLHVSCSGIVKHPKWLQHDAQVIRLSQKVRVNATSDVGQIESSSLTYKVDNENILTIDDSGLIIPKRTGETMVTITSKQSGVSTTFTVQVISDASTLYIGTTTMYVADGYQMYMPTVHYANGREATVDWVITHDNPGDGNPNKSGFTVEGNVISCKWPTASCEVTGTLKSSNEKVKVTVYGYRLPETIVLEPEQLWLKVGERKEMTVSTPEAGTKIVYTFWMSEPAGVVTMEEIAYGTKNTITGVSEGVALVAAMLENETMAVSLVTVYDPAKRLPGDANGDGLVNIYDPLLVMQYTAGWSVAINGHQGDVNADGSTDLQDAIRILQHDSGLDVELRQYIPAP